MISIIIIVKNDLRIAWLLKKLHVINSKHKIETIVVDASNGTLDHIKKSYKDVKWFHYFNKDVKSRTYSEQRNIGVKNSKGNIIVFIDADCIPDKDWLSNLVMPIIEEKEYIVSGSVKPMGNSFIHKEELYGKYRDECETMNIAISKVVFDKIGLFDEKLEGCEDSDFCIRARNKGYKIRHQKTAIIFHDWGGFKQNILRSFNGGQDRVSFYKKYPKLFFSFTINNIYTWFYIFYILFLPVTLYIPFYPVILFLPSVIKLRNPLKEIYNLAFSCGAYFKLAKLVFI